MLALIGRRLFQEELRSVIVDDASWKSKKGNVNVHWQAS